MTDERLAELEKKARERVSPQMQAPKRDPLGLNAPVAWRMVAVDDPDTDMLELIAEVRRLRGVAP